MACGDFPDKTTGETLLKDATTINEIVTSPDDLTNPASDGKQKETLVGLSKKFGVVIVGDYVDGTVLTNIYDGASLTSNGTYWAPVNYSDLPITIDATTYPNPEDHVPALRLYGDVNSSNLSTYLPDYTDLVFDSVADAVASVSIGSTPLNSKLRVEDYYGTPSPNNSGVLFFTVVSSGTGVADGGKFIDVPGGLFQLEQTLTSPYNPRKWGCYCDMTNDDTTAFTNCVNFVENLGSILYFDGKIRLTSTITVGMPISITGENPNPYLGSIGNYPSGSWLYFDHTGIGINVEGVGQQFIGSVFLDKFGTIRNQPEPVDGSFAPLANDFDIVFNNTDLIIGTLMLLNPTKGIRGINGNAGRFTVTGILRGQPLDIGLQLDDQYDAPNIAAIHWWPFWRITDFSVGYMLQNLIGIHLLRVDNPFIGRLFTIFCRAGIKFSNGVNGTTSKLRIDSVDFDRGNTALWFDNTSNGVTAMLGNVTMQGETGLPGTIGIVQEGINSDITISNLNIQESDANAIRSVTGSSNKLTVTNTIIGNFDQSGTGFAAIEVNSGNEVYLVNKPRFTGTGSTKYGGTGTIFVDEWRDYNPTVSATSGSITSYSATGKYKLFNDTVDISYSIDITDNGTAAGSMLVSLPFNSSDGEYVGSGRETTNTGHALTTTVASSTGTALVVNYIGAYPATNGAHLITSASYNIA